MTESLDMEGWRAINVPVTEEFRANQGRVGGRFEGRDLLLLTTTGAKSGRPRVAPLTYFTIDGKVIVVGSRAGAPKHPDWVHNLRANPAAHVEMGGTDYDVVVRELPAAERDDTFGKIVEQAPRFGDYQAKTGRVIPLFELQRV
ncbi:nitroreductase family deazaflavin-dependent oxidoreductase [Mycobacterium sp. URHB0021]|jgi:deazaflavin-dependent oxidoreductase (nitroreductase family)